MSESAWGYASGLLVGSLQSCARPRTTNFYEYAEHLLAIYDDLGEKGGVSLNDTLQAQQSIERRWRRKGSRGSTETLYLRLAVVMLCIVLTALSPFALTNLLLKPLVRLENIEPRSGTFSVKMEESAYRVSAMLRFTIVMSNLSHLPLQLDFGHSGEMHSSVGLHAIVASHRPLDLGLASLDPIADQNALPNHTVLIPALADGYAIPFDLSIKELQLDRNQTTEALYDSCHIGFLVLQVQINHLTIPTFISVSTWPPISVLPFSMPCEVVE